ncbi:MAG TPA: GFA family protein [Methyloceanibacter sp.]|nr:GFA family protein [Methyloceanibacter sp.]
MAGKQIYEGGCHCGRVRYRAKASLERVLDCNCSICRKRGALWTYVQPEEFELLSGESDLSDYQFNNKIIHHVFCRHCGVGSYSYGPAPSGENIFALNVRCLDGVDVASLTLTPFDGKSL